MQCPVSFYSVINGRFVVFLGGGVVFECRRRAAVGFDLLGDALGCIKINVGDDDLGALCRELLGEAHYCFHGPRTRRIRPNAMIIEISASPANTSSVTL